MRYDEFIDKNGSVDPDVIEDPNITRQKTTLAENAAKAGFKAVPTASEGQRELDYVKDLGMESPEEVAARSESSDLEKALGPDLLKAANRRKKEMTDFNDALEQCGGTMTQEDYEMLTDTPNYESMLVNPPDPLNKELKQYRDEQIKKVRETATPEELAAMGLTPEEPVRKRPEVKPVVQEENVVLMPTKNEDFSEEDEDEEIMSEMDILTPEIPELDDELKETIEAEIVPEEKEEIPVITETYDVPAMTEETKEAQPEDDEPYLDDDPNKEIVKKTKSQETLTSLNDVDIDKEMDELDKEDEDRVESQRVYREKLKSAGQDIKNKVIPLATKINIQGFTMSNKPVSINNSVDMAKAVHQGRSARWALFSTGLPIIMSEMSGTEIDELVRLTEGNPRSYTSSDMMKRYSLFYNHILSPKPADVESWLKVVSVMDIKHLYAGIYKASFSGINFLPIDCSNERCNNGFITDNVPFEDMVRYEDDEAKKKAMEIYRSEVSKDKYELYHTEVVPISDVYAFSFREPSIWDAQVAPLYLDNDWYAKMEGPIAINTYVDKIYVIDQTTKTIRPLGVKEYPNDEKKTLKAKVLALAKVISTLTSDQYNLISAYIEEINKPSSYVEYQLPEVICPKCKAKIEAVPTSSSRLLFTRHRVTSLANG